MSFLKKLFIINLFFAVPAVYCPAAYYPAPIAIEAPAVDPVVNHGYLVRYQYIANNSQYHIDTHINIPGYDFSETIRLINSEISDIHLLNQLTRAITDNTCEELEDLFLGLLEQIQNH
jgi:hypothetical protein